MKRTKRLALMGLLASVALILSYIEALLPPIVSAVPGVKVGLPNIVIIFALYRLGVKEAVTVSVLRLASVTLLFGNPVMLLYSLAGAALSLVLMALCKRLDLFSTVGVSIVGGVMHNAGQVLVAMLLLETAEIGYYMLVLAISGTVAGVFIGLSGVGMLRALRNVRIL